MKEETKIKPKIGLEINGEQYNYKVFESLKSLSKTHSLRKTASELNISHSVLDRRIKKLKKN